MQYPWFYIGWGLNYFREDFYSRTHTPKIEYTETQYNQFLRTYTDSLNASFVEVNTINRDLVATKVKESYKKMADRLGLIKPASNLHAPINEEINISETAGGQKTVYLRFFWRDIFSWYWMVDDIELAQPYEHAIAPIMTRVRRNIDTFLIRIIQTNLLVNRKPIL